ncbi:hypothetical protein ACQJBY_045344 [Aegilops geniculata]
MEQNVLEQILEGSIDPTHIPLVTLWKITDGFSPDRIIGEWGFATVYKGVVGNWSVAVKKIRSVMTIDDKLFRREVGSLLEVNHPNVVRFLGLCSDTVETPMKIPDRKGYIYAEIRERLMCFEYISNGSLDTKITDELRGFEWDKRYQIIRGICAGLHYLHMEKHILHMDLKPANILLNDGMVPKITDFGLSRPIECSQTMAEIHFSLGYCAPEILFGGRMSPKSDMYSLGVIIVELVTGHKGTPNKDNILRRWRHIWNKSAKKIPPEYHQQVTKCLEIGSLCQNIDPSARPSILEVTEKILEIVSTNNHSGNDNELTGGEINILAHWEDDMLDVEPLEMQFGYNKQKQILLCSVELSNDTDGFIAYKIQKTSLLPYSIEPNSDIVKPQSKHRVDISLPIAKSHDHEEACKYKQCKVFIVQSIKVNEGYTTHDIEDMLDKHSTDHHVDEIHLEVVSEKPCSKEEIQRFGKAEPDDVEAGASRGTEMSPVEPADVEAVLISKVRPQLRRVDEDAFTPHGMVIGLYNHGKGLSKWTEMKEQAVRDMLSVDQAGVLLAELRNVEDKARRCYADAPDRCLSSMQFSNMLLHDGCYLLSLFLDYGARPELGNSAPQPQYRYRYPESAGRRLSRSALVRDTVFLVENQIPFFVLEKIHDVVTGGITQFTVIQELAVGVQQLLQAQRFISEEVRLWRVPPSTSHLLHLVHAYFQLNMPRIMVKNRIWIKGRWRRATEYSCYANLRFKRKDFMDGIESSILDVRYEEGTLWIPPLRIDGNTLTILRNLMALEEEEHIPHRTVTAYCVFLSQLAGTVEESSS